ncbi:MAG: NADH-quinone oxidoreductase subunit A [Infirmifilum sp.]
MVDPATTLLVVTGLGVLAGLLVLLLAFLLEKGPEGKFKAQRYEAGNPPKGEAKMRLPYQYYGYLLLYLGVEPLVILLYLLPYSSLSSTFLVVGLIILILTPVMIWGLRQSDNINLWRI